MSMFFTKLAEDGFIKFDGHLFGKTALEIGRNIGSVMDITGVSAVQELSPNRKDSLEASSYSGNYGTGEFPFHSDMAHWFQPPRYLLLCCKVPAISVETRITKSQLIFEDEEPFDLRRALFRPRRRLNGRLSPLRLFEGDFYRWDSLFIQPINKLASSLRYRVLDRLAVTPYKAVVLGRSNECVLIDNWKTFHSRSSVPSNGMNRKLERVYLSEVNE